MSMEFDYSNIDFEFHANLDNNEVSFTASRVERLVRWTWHTEGNIKLNVDGSSRGNPGNAGFRGLI